MMKKKMLILITLMLMCALMTAQAAEGELVKIIMDGEVQLSGTVGREYSGQQASLIVLNDGYTESDFLNSDVSTEAVAAYKECTIDDEGGYTFSFIPENGTGDYYAILSLDGTQIRQTLRIAEKSDYDAAAAVVKAAAKSVADGADGSVLSAAIKANSAEILLDLDEFYNRGTESEIISMLADYYKNNEAAVEAMDGYAFSALITKAAAASALNKNAVSVDYNMLESVGASDRIKKYFGYEFMKSASAYEEASKIMKRNKFILIEEFEKRLDEATVLTVTRFADGFGYVKDVLNDFSDVTGISVTVATDSACRAVLGTSYSSYSELKAALETAKPQSLPPSGGGGGGSAGGVSIGSMTGTFPVSTPAPVDGGETADNVVFDDISDVAWAEEAITALAEKGIINGREERIFAPNDNILREEFVKIIMLACDFADIKGEIAFSDVPENAWYYPYVKNAYLCGIINGRDENTFGAGDNITRQDMAVIIANAAKAMSVEFPENEGTEFADESDISDYAKNAVHSLQSAGVITGKDNNHFDPLGSATRAEAAKMVYGFLKLSEINE